MRQSGRRGRVPGGGTRAVHLWRSSILHMWMLLLLLHRMMHLRLLLLLLLLNLHIVWIRRSSHGWHVTRRRGGWRGLLWWERRSHLLLMLLLLLLSHEGFLLLLLLLLGHKRFRPAQVHCSHHGRIVAGHHYATTGNTLTGVAYCTSRPRNNRRRGRALVLMGVASHMVVVRMHRPLLLLLRMAHHWMGHSEGLSLNGRSHPSVASIRWVWPLQRGRGMIS